jgi:transposase-like protein
MSKKRKTWSRSEKLEIINSSKSEGIVEASRKYGISVTSIYKWQSQLDSGGTDSLDRKIKEKRDLEKVRLEREIHALKMIVAEKELVIRIQEEMLKKSH